MISWWGLFQSISFTKYRLRVIVNLWIKINEILVSLMNISFTQYSLYWIQHVAMLLVPFLLNAQVFLFVEESKSLFFFLWYLATNFLNPIVLLYTGPPIHPTTKKLSAMACPLLLHLLPLPHPCSSTCGLGSSCQPGLCALSGSEVGERFVFLIVFGNCNDILSLVDEMVFMNNSKNACLWVVFNIFFALSSILIHPVIPSMDLTTYCTMSGARFGMILLFQWFWNDFPMKAFITRQ